jgi:hypothetical protein
MISESEVKVLELLSKQLLAKPDELKNAFGEEDGVMSTLQKREAMDYVKVVEPIGEKCFVITQKGTRILREAKNPEKRAAMAQQQQHAFLTS